MIDEKIIVLLGGNILNGGIVSNKHKFGASKVIVVDWGENPAIKGDEFFQCDIKDSRKIIEYLKNRHIEDIEFVYTSADLAVNSQRAIHQEYGLKTLEKNIIDETLQKSVMTRIWSEKGLLNRISLVADNAEKIKNIEKSKEWIIKPNLCSGSRGISIIGPDFTEEELEKACERALNSSWDDKIVVEEFVRGTEYTVEMLGDAYGNVDVECISKKYHTNNTCKNSISVKLHYNPEDVSDGELKRIADYGRKCYKALGLHTSMGHLELIVCEDGRISPLEIGARSSGYIASHCVDAVTGGCFLEDYKKVIRGEKLENRYCFETNRSSMLFFYDMPSGTTLNDGNIMDFTKAGIKSLANDRSQIKKGITYRSIDGDGERYGFEVLAGDRDILTIENVLDAEKKLNKWLYEGIK